MEKILDDILSGKFDTKQDIIECIKRFQESTQAQGQSTKTQDKIIKSILGSDAAIEYLSALVTDEGKRDNEEEYVGGK